MMAEEELVRGKLIISFEIRAEEKHAGLIIECGFY